MDKHRDRLLDEARARYRAGGRKYVYYMMKRAERRAKAKGIPFELVVDDIVIPQFCPILGIELKVGETRGPDDLSPSLDRLVPELGYVKGNVQVISMRANHMKSSATIEDIEKLLAYLKNHQIAK